MPEADLRRRFLPSLCNLFRLYLPLADEALLYNAAGNPPRLVAHWKGNSREIIEHQIYERIQNQIKKALNHD